MQNVRRKMGAALIGAGFAVNASAHHSAAPHFDVTKTIELQATVTKFEFVNPHGYVYFNVVGADGKPAPWRCELSARTPLARLGWTQDTFTPGQKVTIKGAPARREDNVCMLTSFVRSDGREITRNDDLTKSASNLSGSNPLATIAKENQLAGRPTRLANGQPNLQGPWISPFGPGGRGGAGKKKGPDGRGPGGPARPEMTEAGERAAQKYDQRFDDPAIKCSPANILFGWTHDQHVNEITQTEKLVTLKYGYMDFVRTIHLDATEHPKNLKPSTAGHSIGKWEGDVLVVDTAGFEPSVLIPLAGLMHSGQMHVVERFSVDPATVTLTRAYRVEDPLYLKSEYTGRDVMNLSQEPFVPYNCVELSGKNNIRPK